MPRRRHSSTSLPDSTIGRDCSVYWIGDQAFEWLERGFEQRDLKMAFLKVEPKWNNVRDDPRFMDLMRRVGFSQ
jgi:hypothetical protein